MYFYISPLYIYVAENTNVATSAAPTIAVPNQGTSGRPCGWSVVPADASLSGKGDMDFQVQSNIAMGNPISILEVTMEKIWKKTIKRDLPGKVLKYSSFTRMNEHYIHWVG